MHTKNENNGSAHITPVGGNIFSDLGFSDEDSARLQKQSQAAITARLKGSDTCTHLAYVDRAALLDIRK